MKNWYGLAVLIDGLDLYGGCRCCGHALVLPFDLVDGLAPPARLRAGAYAPAAHGRADVKMGCCEPGTRQAASSGQNAAGRTRRAASGSRHREHRRAGTQEVAARLCHGLGATATARETAGRRGARHALRATVLAARATAIG